MMLIEDHACYRERDDHQYGYRDAEGLTPILGYPVQSGLGGMDENIVFLKRATGLGVH
jgi:hypothetical protein